MTAAKLAAVSGFFASANTVIAALKLSPTHGGGGYRLIANTGADGFPEIAHFHRHIVAGLFAVIGCRYRNGRTGI